MPDKKDHPFKNHQMPLFMRIYFSALTVLFKILDLISPSLAGRLALHLFMTPPHFGIPRREKALRDSARLKYIVNKGRKISVHIWGDENNETVLLSHGWGGRSTQFHALIQPLINAGFRVVGFDAPAHGDSQGKQSNMLDVASIIAQIEKEEGLFKAIIGHSFGTSTALLAISKFKVKPEKLVLIAYVADVQWVIKLFGTLFELKTSTLEAMRQRALKTLANTYQISWNWDDISPINTVQQYKGKLLLIHDKDDHEVPYNEAMKLETFAPQATRLVTKGLGHRKILMSRDVIKTVINFLKD